MAEGFLTDATLCIGCKACEVACKEWNQLPADGFQWTGNSYDNTGAFSATSWRHVKFVEEFDEARHGNWLMLSDVCKHCTYAGCLEACPTGAIVRTEFGSVYVKQDVCNGCGYCVPSCPFGVIAIDPADGKAHKCTLCYDRLQHGLQPACAKACPTSSIQFGEVKELRSRAQARIARLRGEGVDARLYGGSELLGGLNAFFIVVGDPRAYNLPPKPRRPADNLFASSALSILAAGLMAVAAGLIFRRR
jgi:formate dehydrogenase iron-sulfur subunit